MKKKLIIFGLTAVVLAAALFAVNDLLGREGGLAQFKMKLSDTNKVIELSIDKEATKTWRTHASDMLKISFKYPEDYAVEESVWNDLVQVEAHKKVTDPTTVRFVRIDEGLEEASKVYIYSTGGLDLKKQRIEQIRLNGVEGIRRTDYLSHNECTETFYLFERSESETLGVDYFECPSDTNVSNDPLVANSLMFSK